MASTGMCFLDKTLCSSQQSCQALDRAATPSAGPVSRNLHVVSVHRSQAKATHSGMLQPQPCTLSATRVLLAHATKI